MNETVVFCTRELGRVPDLFSCSHENMLGGRKNWLWKDWLIKARLHCTLKPVSSVSWAGSARRPHWNWFHLEPVPVKRLQVVAFSIVELVSVWTRGTDFKPRRFQKCRRALSWWFGGGTMRLQITVAHIWSHGLFFPSTCQVSLLNSAAIPRHPVILRLLRYWFLFNILAWSHTITTI